MHTRRAVAAVISVRSVTLLIFAIGWAVCGQQQLGHKLMMLLLSFSVLSV